MAIGSSNALVTLRPDIASSLLEFDLEANQRKMIALQFAPVIEVDEAFGNWGRIPLAELLKNRDTNRTASGGYTRGDSNFKPDVYATVERGTEERVDDNNAKTYANYFDAELIAAQRARHIVMVGFESRTILTALADLNTNGYTQAATVKWNDTVNATPIDDVRTARDNVFARIGIYPESLEVSARTFEFLKDNQQIIDRLKYAGFQNPNKYNINAMAVAQALGIQEVLVAGAVQNTANEGQAAVLDTIWPKDKACLSVNAKTDNPKEPCFARTFHWGGDGSTIGAAFETYRDEPKRSDVVRARMQTDERRAYVQAGQVITGVYA